MIATLCGPLAGLDLRCCMLLTASLLHFVWQGFLLALVLAAANRILARSSANLRYAAGVATLAAMVICLPATFLTLERLELGRATVEIDIPLATNSNAGAVGQIIVDAVETTASVWDDGWRAFKSSARSMIASASTSATAIYAAGLTAMLARVLLGLAIGRSWRRAATRIDDPLLLEFVRRQADRLALRAVPAIAWCGRASTPVVVGILRPMILLPAALASGLTTCQLELVLLHELAHIRRFDPIVNLLQRLVEAAGFFHPAVWWASRQVSLEREHVCDDAVVRAGCRKAVYADALVRVAELCAAISHERTSPAGSLAAIGSSRQQLRRRVLRLLEADAPASVRSRMPGVALALALTAGLLLTLAAWHGPALAEDAKNPAAAAEEKPAAPVEVPAEPATAGDPEATALAGQTIAEIRVVGNDARPTSQILAAISTRVDRPFDPSLLEKDVRTLAQKKWFTDVRPIREQVPGGVRITFEVVERPTLLYVKYLGNNKIKDKRLAKETELKKGSTLDPAAVEESRRKIEAYYRSKGYNDVRVTVSEGAKPGDRGVIFMIDEGQAQKINKTTFVGNTIHAPRPGQAGPNSSPPMFGLFRNPEDQEAVDQDIERLGTHYRNLGFFRVKIDCETVTGEETQQPRLTCFVDEGPRYHVAAVKFSGNNQITDESLSEAAVALKADEPFLRLYMERDVAKLKRLYRQAGYEAAIEPELQRDDDAATVAIEYRIVEGEKGKALIESKPSSQAKIDEFEIITGDGTVKFESVEVTSPTAPPVLGLFKSLKEGTDVEQDTEKLIQYYRNLGFFRAKVSRVGRIDRDSREPKLTFVINEGPRYRIAAVKFVGNGQLDDAKLADELATKSGQVYLRRDLDRDLAKLKSLYHDAGHKSATVEHALKSDDDAETVSIEYRIVEGEKSSPEEPGISQR